MQGFECLGGWGVLLGWHGGYYSLFLEAFHSSN